MGTQIRPEISKKSKYYISKERYYELVHFCRQYYEYEKEYTRILNDINISANLNDVKTKNTESSVERTILIAQEYADKIAIIKKCCLLATDSALLSNYILRAVTKGETYEKFRTQDNIPICKNTFYEYYRKFFWLLDKERR